MQKTLKEAGLHKETTSLGQTLDVIFKELGMPRTLKEVGVEGKQKMEIIARKQYQGFMHTGKSKTNAQRRAGDAGLGDGKRIRCTVRLDGNMAFDSCYLVTHSWCTQLESKRLAVKFDVNVHASTASVAPSRSTFQPLANRGSSGSSSPACGMLRNEVIKAVGQQQHTGNTTTEGHKIPIFSLFGRRFVVATGRRRLLLRYGSLASEDSNGVAASSAVVQPIHCLHSNIR